jgi:PAS domain S-box-containing protein
MNKKKGVTKVSPEARRLKSEGRHPASARDQEQRYRAAEKIGHMGSWERNLQTNELLWSDELFRIYGLKPGAHPVSTEFFLENIVHPEDRKLVSRHIRSIYSKNDDAALTYRIITPQGVRIVFSKPQITIRKGKVTAIRGIVQDITAQKIAEEEIIRLKLSQQSQIMNAILQAQEAERNRIGEALHNGVGQLLYAIKLQLESVRDPNPQNLRSLTAITSLLQEAISETRNISFDLVPTVLKDFGLTTSIRDLVRRFGHYKIRIVCKVSGVDCRLNETLEIGVYRVVQELLNNVMKHSNASKATLTISFRARSLRISLTDNGQGFNVEKAFSNAKGLGLPNIRSRIQLMGGTLNISSHSAKGTRVTISIPLK